MIARITTYLSIAAVFIGTIVSGTLVSSIDAIMRKFVANQYGGKPLPALSDSFLAYTTAGHAHTVSIGFGIAMAILLTYLARSPGRSAYLPITISVAWIAILMQIATAIIAVSILFISPISSMQE
jgi:hypothetical protein